MSADDERETMLAQALAQLARGAPPPPSGEEIRRRLRWRLRWRIAAAMAPAAAAAAAVLLVLPSLQEQPLRHNRQIASIPSPGDLAVPIPSGTGVIDGELADAIAARSLARLHIAGELRVDKRADGSISFVVFGGMPCSSDDVRRVCERLLANYQQATIHMRGGKLALSLIRIPPI